MRRNALKKMLAIIDCVLGDPRSSNNSSDNDPYDQIDPDLCLDLYEYTIILYTIIYL